MPQTRPADLRLPVLSSGPGRELVFPGALMTRAGAKQYADRNMPGDLARAGFKSEVFESDPEIQGSHYFRIGYGKLVLT